MLQIQGQTSFWGLFPSQGAVSFETSLWGVFNPTLANRPYPPLQSHLCWGWSKDAGPAAWARGLSSRLVAETSPTPFLMGNGKMNANQSRDVISQALCHLGHPNLCEKCHQSSAELVAL